MKEQQKQVRKYPVYSKTIKAHAVLCKS